MDTDKRFKISFAILSAGYILLGAMHLAMGAQADRFICLALGIMGIITGLIRITFYFVKDNPARAFRNDLATGIILIAAGLYIIVQWAAIAPLLPVLLGFCIVFDSIIKLQYSFDLRRTAFGLWWIVLVAAILTGVLGALLIFGTLTGDALHYYFGTVLLIDGVLNLAVLLMMILRLRKAAQAAAQPPPATPPQQWQTPPPQG